MYEYLYDLFRLVVRSWCSWIECRPTYFHAHRLGALKICNTNAQLLSNVGSPKKSSPGKPFECRRLLCFSFAQVAIFFLIQKRTISSQCGKFNKIGACGGLQAPAGCKLFRQMTTGSTQLFEICRPRLVSVNLHTS